MRASGGVTFSALPSNLLQTLCFVGVIFGLVSASARLPEKSSDLLEKLAHFEEKETVNLQALVADRREKAVTLLNGHLEEQRKNGDLDATVAIKAAIDSLASGSEVEASDELPEDSADLLKKLRKFESAMQSEFGALLMEKTEAVASLLEEQMKAETKQGRLEQAVGLNEAIKMLKSKLEEIETGLTAKVEPVSRIPDDAIEHNGVHFKAYVTRTSIEWDEAREECRKLEGRLAWFDSPSDEKLIRTLLEGVNDQVGHVPVWVGGLNDSDGMWHWLNGEPVDPDFWANAKDSAPNDQELKMCRWIGSFKAYQEDIPRVVGYICRWE